MKARKARIILGGIKLPIKRIMDGCLSRRRQRAGIADIRVTNKSIIRRYFLTCVGDDGVAANGGRGEISSRREMRVMCSVHVSRK